MEIKNLEQALKLQQDLTAKLTQSMDMLRARKTPSLEALLKDKEQAIARTQAEMDAAVKERDTAVSRWDERIAQRKAGLAQLQAEMTDLKKQLETHKKPG